MYNLLKKLFKFKFTKLLEVLAIFTIDIVTPSIIKFLYLMKINFNSEICKFTKEILIQDYKNYTIINCVSYQKHSYGEVRKSIFMKIYLTKIPKYQLFAAGFNKFLNSMVKYEKKLLYTFFNMDRKIYSINAL